MAEERLQKVANKKDLRDGSLLKVEAQGKQIVLSMIEGKIYAIDEICTHEGGPLDEGELDGTYNLKYPWHWFLMLEMGNYQMPQCGLLTSTRML